MSEADPNSGNEKALVTAPVGAELVRLGRRKEIRELTKRVQLMAPSGMKLTTEEALTLAQYSYSLGANPLTGETWLLKDDSGKVLGLMPGVRLYRRRADEQDERRGDHRWLEADPIIDPDERVKLNIPDGAVAVKIRLYRQSQTKAYAELAQALAAAGAPWEDIKEIAGTKPYTEGVGVIKGEEIPHLTRGSKQMPLHTRAAKRAEVNALGKVYHLPFGFAALAEGVDFPEGATVDEYIPEAEWREIPEDEPKRTPEEIQAAGVKASEALYGDGTTGLEPQKPAEKPSRELDPREKPSYWPQAVLAAIIEAMLSENEFAAAKTLARSPFDSKVAKSAAMAFMRVYRGARDEGKGVDAAILQATAEWKRETKEKP